MKHILPNDDPRLRQLTILNHVVKALSQSDPPDADSFVEQAE